MPQPLITLHHSMVTESQWFLSTLPSLTSVYATSTSNKVVHLFRLCLHLQCYAAVAIQIIQRVQVILRCRKHITYIYLLIEYRQACRYPNPGHPCQLHHQL